MIIIRSLKHMRATAKTLVLPNSSCSASNCRHRTGGVCLRRSVRDFVKIASHTLVFGVFLNGSRTVDLDAGEFKYFRPWLACMVLHTYIYIYMYVCKGMPIAARSRLSRGPSVVQYTDTNQSKVQLNTTSFRVYLLVRGVSLLLSDVSTLCDKELTQLQFFTPY